MNEQNIPSRKMRQQSVGDSNNATTDHKKAKRNKKKRTWKQRLWLIWCVFFIIILIGSVAVGAVGLFVLADAQKNLPAIDVQQVIAPDNSIVLDANGELVADLAEDANVVVSYDEIPESLKDAFTSIEDARFFVHKGIDGPRTLKAVFVSYIIRSGDEGGSTLTQQLVKQTLLDEKISADPDYKQSPKRKIDEWLLAYQLEQTLTKEEIFTAYVNNAINYLQYTGVGTAAKRYFNKTVSELTIPEAALLAGIPQLPAYNNPFYNIEGATERYNAVLTAMEYHGTITVEERDAAMQIPLADLVARNQDEFLNRNYAYFSAVTEELNQIFNVDTTKESDVAAYYKNYRIYTALNREQQSFADTIMNTNDYVAWDDAVGYTYGWSDVSEEENLNFQGAFTVVNNANGEIPAVGAARNVYKTGQNIAVTGYKSPGSSIKPILDYTPVVEKFDWSANHVMNDKVTYYSGTNSQVYNYNYGGHKGFIPMQKAIADSTNTTAVRAVQLTGLDYAVDIATNMGLTQGNKLYQEGLIGEAAALGGGLDVTTAELAGAYSVLANGGKYHKPHTIRKIERIDTGEVIYDYEQAHPEQQVIKESTAATMTQALIYSRQTGTPAHGRKQVSGAISFGAKTGTSSYDGSVISEYGVSPYAEKDHWHAGYSPEYAIAVWTGLAVEDEATLRKTGGNVNSNKAVGSYVMAAWINEFSPRGTSFDFLGSANQGSQGGIGGFSITNHPGNSSVSWTMPDITYPSGMVDEDKAAFGSVVFDVRLNTTSGSVALASGTTDLSVSYATYAYTKGIQSVTVTARMNNENANEVMPPIEGSVEVTTKEKTNDNTTGEISTTSPIVVGSLTSPEINLTSYRKR